MSLLRNSRVMFVNLNHTAAKFDNIMFTRQSTALTRSKSFLISVICITHRNENTCPYKCHHGISSENEVKAQEHFPNTCGAVIALKEFPSFIF